MDRVGVRVRIYWQGGLIDSRFVTSERVQLGAVEGPGVDFVVPIVELDDPIVVAEITPAGITAWIPELGGARRGGPRRLEVGAPVRFEISKFVVELEAEPARRLPRFDGVRLNASAARVLMLSVAAHVVLAVGAAVTPRPEALAVTRMRAIAEPRSDDVFEGLVAASFAPPNKGSDAADVPLDRSREAIRAVIVAARPEVRACLVSARDGARIALRWTIDESGSVYAARVLASERADPHEIACSIRVVKAMKFERARKWTIVTYPWIVRQAPD